ncbi:hypothetical protein P2318_17240 [Myxococcaceae bacterium GXIMD 01537]
MRLSAVATVVLLSTTGCVKEISSDERLDRETRSTAVGDTPEASDLAKLSCDNVAEDLLRARNVNRPETDRLVDYITLFDSLRKRAATFEEAMARNPDLAYRDGSQQIVAAKDTCIQQTADVRVEFETYMRELVDVPTVQEIKGGNTVTVARLDFTTLRQAIDTLAPDDKEQLATRLEAAEKKLSPAKAAGEEETAPASSGGGRRRNR